MKGNFIPKEYLEDDLSELFKIIQREQITLEDIEIIAVIINNNGENILDTPHKEIGLSAKEFLQVIGGSSSIIENAIELNKQQYINSVNINQKKEQKNRKKPLTKISQIFFRKQSLIHPISIKHYKKILIYFLRIKYSRTKKLVCSAISVYIIV